VTPVSTVEVARKRKAKSSATFKALEEVELMARKYLSGVKLDHDFVAVLAKSRKLVEHTEASYPENRELVAATTRAVDIFEALLAKGITTAELGPDLDNVVALPTLGLETPTGPVSPD
jgi:hypothetical protein